MDVFIQYLLDPVAALDAGAELPGILGADANANSLDGLG